MTRFQMVAATLVAVSALTACAKKEEVVYLEPAPIAAEPAYTKY